MVAKKQIDGMVIMRQNEMTCPQCGAVIDLKQIYFHLQIEKCPGCDREYSFRNNQGEFYFQLIAEKKSKAKLAKHRQN